MWTLTPFVPTIISTTKKPSPNSQEQCYKPTKNLRGRRRILSHETLEGFLLATASPPAFAAFSLPAEYIPPRKTVGYCSPRWSVLALTNRSTPARVSIPASLRPADDSGPFPRPESHARRT